MTQPSLNPPPAGAPAPKVVLLPDALFFSRAIPMSATATPAEAAIQAELGLEALSPFPPAQLYHGFFWEPGAERALVFAAYRRRFTREQVEAWSGAELVLPAFAALLGGEVAPATTLLVTSADGLTAIHWDQGAVPAAVLFRPLPAEVGDEERARVRDELLRTAGGSREVIELAAPPVVEPASGSEDEFVFRAESRVSRLSPALAAAMDVRDKTELAALRRARARDVMLWRGFLGCAAAIGLIALSWAGLYGAGFWQKIRETKVTAQQPVVDQIMTQQVLATHINELSTKRLLPLEMISLVSGTVKPASIEFLHATTDGLYTLKVEAQTTSPAEVSTFRSALRDLPACEKVEVLDQRTRDNLMSFTLVVTFHPEALKPATAS
jgi:hypothetical protein